MTLLVSCAPQNGIFGTAAELAAAQPLVDGWTHQPPWARAGTMELPWGLVSQTISSILHTQGSDWRTIVLLFAPDANDLRKWQSENPKIRWAWLDVSGKASNLPNSLRLIVDPTVGWNQLGKTGALVAKKQKTVAAVVLIHPETSTVQRQALRLGWSTYQKTSSLQFIEIPESIGDPGAQLRFIPAGTNCLFLLLGPPSADLANLLPANDLRFGDFVPKSSLRDWDAVEVPNGPLAYSQVMTNLTALGHETLKLPWKSVLTSR